MAPLFLYEYTPYAIVAKVPAIPIINNCIILVLGNQLTCLYWWSRNEMGGGQLACLGFIAHCYQKGDLGHKK